jgi:hypothetical protein
MNSKLRKAVYKKRQLHNVFKTQRSSKSWEQYRKQRNIVTKIKRKFPYILCNIYKEIVENI